MAAAVTLETDRLILRGYEPGDVDPLFSIQSDAAAMRYTYCAESRGDTERHLCAHAAMHAEYGVAPWTVLLRSESRVIGWGGLLVDPEDSSWGIEVGYFLHSDYWGRGIASEVVRAALAHGFDDLGLPEIAALARPENGASLRVLEKAGFARVAYVASLERNHYKLLRADWLG